MQRKYTNANAQALAVYQALQQTGGLTAALDDDAATALYLAQNPSSTGEMGFSPALLERLTKGLDKGGMGSMVLDPFCSYDYADRRHIRNFSMSVPINFGAFDGIRRSKHDVKLTPAQEENVLKSFDKLLNGEDSKKSGGGSGNGAAAKKAREISMALPFVSAFFDQRCPELRNETLTSAREGATYLLLSVITGHTALCSRCLAAGANPNSLTFLRDESPAPGDMFHGYSPLFLAVLGEQLEVLELLSKYGGSVHVYDRWGRTPLHAAMSIDSDTVVQWLLGKGAPRYVPDGFNTMPADNGLMSQYAQYGMPQLALMPPPAEPPASYFAEAAKGYASPAAEGESSSATAKPASATSEIVAATDAAATVAPSLSSASEEKWERCPCHSGRPVGFCGCADDMVLRWSRDRLNTEWSPGVDFSALARRQSSAEEERKRTGTAAAASRAKA